MGVIYHSVANNWHDAFAVVEIYEQSELAGKNQCLWMTSSMFRNCSKNQIYVNKTYRIVS
jgi:hypothetical protein